MPSRNIRDHLKGNGTMPTGLAQAAPAPQSATGDLYIKILFWELRPDSSFRLSKSLHPKGTCERAVPCYLGDLCWRFASPPLSPCLPKTLLLPRSARSLREEAKRMTSSCGIRASSSGPIPPAPRSTCALPTNASAGTSSTVFPDRNRCRGRSTWVPAWLPAENSSSW